MDFCTAYNWLMAHPGFGRFGICIDVDVVKVDPTTETIEKDESRNTATRVWLETGQWDLGGNSTHDPVLDTGAPTYEEAIILLADLVKAKYGDYVASAVN